MPMTSILGMQRTMSHGIHADSQNPPRAGFFMAARYKTLYRSL